MLLMVKHIFYIYIIIVFELKMPEILCDLFWNSVGTFTCIALKRDVFHDILLCQEYLHLYSLIFPVKHILLKGPILV